MQIHMLKSMQKKKVGEKERGGGGGGERERGREREDITYRQHVKRYQECS